MTSPLFDTSTMSKLLTGQVALVTGAGQGNGAAIARGLAGCDAHVVLSDQNVDRVQAVTDEITQAGGKATCVPFDVTDKAAITAAAAQCQKDIGPVDILVNNAGIIDRVAVDDDALLDSAQRLWEVNAQGTLMVTQAFLSQLRQTKGRVVNLASIASFISYANVTGYAASKGAVAQITRALAVELAPDDIRVNAIAPGVIATPMTQQTRDDPARIGAFLQQTPMGRVG